MNRRPFWRAAVLVGAVAIVALALVSAGRTGPRTPAAVPSQKIPAVATTPAGSSIDDPLDGSWWHFSANFAGPSDLVGMTLLAGTFRAGTTVTMTRDLPHLDNQSMRGGLPYVFGPIDQGEMGYGLWTGLKSEIHAVTVATGADRLLLESTDVIHSAVFDPTTSTLYYVSLHPLDRMRVALMRVSVLGGPPVKIAALPAATSTQVDLRLVVSPDGRWTVVLDCRLACVALGYRTDQPVDDSAWEPNWTVAFDGYDALGISEDIFFAGQACDAPCDLTAIDVDSGHDVGAIRFCSAALTVPSRRGMSVIVSDSSDGRTCREPDYRLYSWERVKEATAPRQIAQFGTALRAVVARNGASGYALPPGWLVVGPHGDLLDDSPQGPVPLLINLDTGAVVESGPLRN